LNAPTLEEIGALYQNRKRDSIALSGSDVFGYAICLKLARFPAISLKPWVIVRGDTDLQFRIDSL
jgi:hypothetical protein